MVNKKERLSTPESCNIEITIRDSRHPESYLTYRFPTAPNFAILRGNYDKVVSRMYEMLLLGPQYSSGFEEWMNTINKLRQEINDAKQS